MLEVRVRKDYFGGYPLANHKSAEKRARQSTRKNAVNTKRKGVVRTAEKSLIKALIAKEAKAIPELLKSFTKQVSKAVNKGVYKKETASRHIARLSKRAQAILSAK